MEDCVQHSVTEVVPGVSVVIIGLLGASPVHIITAIKIVIDRLSGLCCISMSMHGLFNIISEQ